MHDQTIEFQVALQWASSFDESVPVPLPYQPSQPVPQPMP